MNIRYAWVLAGGLVLGGCATGGSHVGVEPGNSRSQCASQMALEQVPAGDLHDYMRRCTAGNVADESSSDEGFHIGVSGGTR